MQSHAATLEEILVEKREHEKDQGRGGRSERDEETDMDRILSLVHGFNFTLVA
jgi:hypothetical protein